MCPCPSAITSAGGTTVVLQRPEPGISKRLIAGGGEAGRAGGIGDEVVTAGGESAGDIS